MYKLVYIIKGITTIARNKDCKVLRNIIKCLDKEDTWELYNEGGCRLDSSYEFAYFKGLPKRGV